MNPSSKFNDEENLKLHLRSSEGKGLSEECIDELLKKECFIPTNNFKLREVLRIGTVFTGCFWNKGINFSELKTGLEMIMKRDATIKRHFKNDPLFGARLISAIDNHFNLLLDECESASSPNDIKSYFSIKHIFQQVERGSFNFTLPGVLTPKRQAIDQPLNLDRKKKAKTSDNDLASVSKRVANGVMIVKDWKLGEDEEFKTICTPQALADRPLHSSGCKLCHKFAVKGYCFIDCPNKGSHKA